LKVVPTGPGKVGGGMTGAILVQQIWGDSFYHWMIECLPRLNAIEPAILSNSSVALLVPALNVFITEALGLLGIHQSRLRVLTHATYYTVSDLWLPPPGVCGLGPATRLVRGMNVWLRLGVGEAQESGSAGSHASLDNVGSGRCLVVQRHQVGGRHVENHDELFDALNLMASMCQGRWQVVSPVTGGGKMQEVARLFSEAMVVVAPHGGTLANLIFSRGSRAHAEDEQGHDRGSKTASVGTHVLELLPANRPNLCYERLCRALGMPYMGLVVPDTSHNNNMRVDVINVLVALQTLLP